MRAFSRSLVLAEWGLTRTLGISHSGLSAGSGSGEDVQRRPAQVSGPQRLDQRRLVHHRAAGDVDEEGALRQGRQLARADHPLRLRRVGHGQHQVLRLRQHLVQPIRLVVNIHASGPGCTLVPMTRMPNALAMRAISARHAQADDGQGAPRQVGGGVALPTLLPLIRLEARQALLCTSIASMANSASGWACTPLAVVKTVWGMRMS